MTAAGRGRGGGNRPAAGRRPCSAPGEHQLPALGIDPDGTLRDRDLRELPVAHAMMAQARETWLVADVSKFSQPALVEFAHLQDMKRVFTEALPPAPFPALLHEWGIALTIAS